MNSYLQSMYRALLTDISASRKISIDSLHQIADAYRIRNADDALRFKFVDGKLYKDELLTMLKKQLGVAEKKELSSISLLDYTGNGQTKTAGARIAVLYAVGDIVDGEGTDENVGGDRISRELRKLRRDDRVKAVVLRVNSPGGSALASDVIAREVALTKKAKPIVVSMGTTPHREGIIFLH